MSFVMNQVFLAGSLLTRLYFDMNAIRLKELSPSTDKPKNEEGHNTQAHDDERQSDDEHVGPDRVHDESEYKHPDEYEDDDRPGPTDEL